jgi:hypothetical protein
MSKAGRAAGVRQLELGPLVRMSARPWIDSRRVGVAYSLDSGETIAKEKAVPFAALSDSDLSFAPGLQSTVWPGERLWLKRVLEVSLVPERHRIASV